MAQALPEQNTKPVTFYARNSFIHGRFFDSTEAGAGSMRRFVTVLGSMMMLAACGGASDGPMQPATPAIVWPVVYDLSLLISPYAPGSEYTSPTTCNRVLRSSLVSGTLTVREDNTAEVYLRAWEETPSSVNAPGIPCPSFITIDRSGTKKGTYSVSGVGAGRQITVTIGTTVFASGSIGLTGFDREVTLAVPGYTLYGFGKPFDPLRSSTWKKR